MHPQLQTIYGEYQKDPGFKHLRKRSNFVPGVGSSTAPQLVIVGEAPGEQEDRQREPFVGRSGQVLDEMLKEVGLHRREVFITNTVKYRPTDEKGKNRKPTPEEVELSRSYIRRELTLLAGTKRKGKRPLIILLGTTAASLLPDQKELFGVHNRGKIVLIRGWRFVHLFHPAVSLYDPSMRKLMFDQFINVAKER